MLGKYIDNNSHNVTAPHHIYMPYLWRKALCVVLRRTIRPGNITSTFMDSLSNTLVDFFFFRFSSLMIHESWFMYAKRNFHMILHTKAMPMCIPKTAICGTPCYRKSRHGQKKKKESERAPVRKVCFLHFCVKPSEFTCGGLDCQNIYIYYLMRAAVNENVIETTAASSASWWTTHGHFWYDPLMMFTFWDR